MSKRQTDSRGLRVLLLLCAGLLLVIVFVLTFTVEESIRSQQDPATILKISGCEAVAHLKYMLPASQQAGSGVCQPESETELR